jgi:hypothetical protein
MNIFQSDTVPFVLPPPAKRGRPSKYPFQALDVHQGFIVPPSEAPQLTSMRLFVQQMCKQLGRTFLLNQEEDGSLIVWRQA